jgi:hypothetical protein
MASFVAALMSQINPYLPNKTGWSAANTHANPEKPSDIPYFCVGVKPEMPNGTNGTIHDFNFK